MVVVVSILFGGVGNDTDEDAEVPSPCVFSGIYGLYICDDLS